MSPKLALLFLAISLSTLSGVALGTTRNSFDGIWTVRVVSAPGGCSDRYNVTIRIANGRINYTGMLAGVGTGSLGAGGRISLHVGEATATGTLAAVRGGGFWRSPSCRGSWTAAKA